MIDVSEFDPYVSAFFFTISLIIFYKSSKTLLGSTLITCLLISINIFLPKNSINFLNYPAYIFFSITPILFYNINNINTQLNNKAQLYSDIMELFCAIVSVASFFLPSISNNENQNFLIHIIISTIPLVYSEINKFRPPIKPTAHEIWLQEKADIAAEKYFRNFLRNRL